MELYHFSMDYIDGTSKTANYTSSQENHEDGGRVYEAIPIDRGEISFEFDETELSLNMPADYWPAIDFKLVNPYGVITLEVRNEVGSLVFSGRVRGATFEVEKGIAKITVTSVQEVLDSQIPVKVYSPSCPYEIYGSKCGVNKYNYLLDTTVSGSTISGKTITNTEFSAFPNGYFAGGWTETEQERVTIVSHIGNTITLMYDFKATVGDDTLRVFPGCDKLLATCANRFSNISKFGGFPWVPLTNPVTEEF